MKTTDRKPLMKTSGKLMPLLLLLLSLATATPMHAEPQLPTDTLLTRLYEQAATLMEVGEYDSAQHCFDRAFATEGVRRSPVYPILLNEQGTLYFYVGQLEKAKEAKLAVLPHLPRVDDLEKHVSAYNDLGVIYHRFNKNDSSFYYYDKALDAAHRYKDDSWLANLYQNVGIMHYNLHHYEEAERQIDLALKYVLRTDDRLVTQSVYQIQAVVKAQIGKTEEAGTAIRQAWQMASQEGGNAQWQLRCIPSFYRYFRQKDEQDSIDHYIAIGNRLLEQLPRNNVIATGFVQVRATNHYERGRYAEALKDFLRLREEGAGSDKRSLFEKMAKCYLETGQERRAYAYMDSARMWTDSLASREVTSQMAEFNVKYQTQEKELEIARLQQERLRHQALLLKVGIAAGVLLAAAFVALLALRQKKRMAEKKMELLKRENELNAARRYIEGLEAESKRFARELHDGIANDLLGLQMKIETSGGGKENGKELAALVSKLRNNVRSISHELMPPEFEHLSLDRILARYADKLTENTGIEVSYHPTAGDASRRLPHETAYELYRIVQELTMNIVKHTAATRIDISLHTDDGKRYILEIEDDGRSVPASAAATDTPEGIGLRTVNDRIKAINATAHTQAEAGKNVFRLTIGC